MEKAKEFYRNKSKTYINQDIFNPYLFLSQVVSLNVSQKMSKWNKLRDKFKNLTSNKMFLHKPLYNYI